MKPLWGVFVLLAVLAACARAVTRPSGKPIVYILPVGSQKGQVVVRAGATQQLYCQVEGIHVGNVTWLFQQEEPGNLSPNASLWEIVASGRWEYKVRSETRVDSILEADETRTGWYRCAARNENGHDHDDIKFIVSSKPIVSILPVGSQKGQVVVRAGDRQQLYCQVEGIHVGNITWLFQQEAPDNLSPNASLWEIVASGRWEYKVRSETRVDSILDADETRTGWYRCAARNENGHDHDDIKFIVSGKPIVSILPVGSQKGQVVVRAGATQQLYCQVEGIHVGNVTWLFQQEATGNLSPNASLWEIVASGRWEYKVRSETRVDSILEADETRTGWYRCAARNENGHDHDDIKFIVYGPVDPVDPSCVDSNDNCAAWKDRGDCETRPCYMKNKCQLSCNTCPVAPLDPVAPACKDSNVYCCPEWKDRGHCETNPCFMKNKCQLSCNTCSVDPVSPVAPSCVDSDDWCCPGWATRGDCAISNWMTANCRLSCQTCPPSS